MRAFTALCILIAAASAAPTEVIYKNFIDWTIQHGKEYSNAGEHQERFTNFQTNLALVNFLNRQNKGATFALNQFADLTQQEFADRYLRQFPTNIARKSTLPYNPRKGYPETWDWRDHGAVSAVKNQGSCGSCWAFSATGNMEGVYQIANKEMKLFSEQQLVDCEHDCMIFPGTTEQVCDEGCNGGLMPNAFTYAIREGMETESDYPYTGKQSKKCNAAESHQKTKFSAWQWVGKNESAMVAALNDIGPLSIAVDATYWSYYSSGIYDSSCSTSRMNHGVLLVGYGKEGQKDYWIIKNSWGTSWGEKGFMRLIRGKNKCGVENFVCTILA